MEKLVCSVCGAVRPPFPTIPDPAEVMQPPAAVVHRSGYGPQKDKYDRVVGWLEKNPACTLASGEGYLLLQRIRELEAEQKKPLSLIHELQLAASVWYSEKIGTPSTKRLVEELDRRNVLCQRAADALSKPNGR